MERATETYDLLKQRNKELKQAHAQAMLLKIITEAAQAECNPAALLSPIARGFAETFAADNCAIQLFETDIWSDVTATVGDPEQRWLSDAAITREAISTQRIQIDSGAMAQERGLMVHGLLPVVYRDQVMAVVSLQWKQPAEVDEPMRQVLALTAGHLALALKSIQC